MKKERISGLIFDLDGTLANTLPLCIAAFRQAVEPLANRTLSDEEIIATFGPSEEGTIQALIPDYFQQGIDRYIGHYEQLHSLCPVPFDGMIELLADLKNRGIRLALVTGKGPRSTAISLDLFKLAPYFEFIETGWIYGPRKAAGIQEILNHWPDLTKDEVWYIGDAPGDIVASRQAGIPVVGAAWAQTANIDELAILQPDHVFTSIREFAQWTEKAV